VLPRRGRRGPRPAARPGRARTLRCRPGWPVVRGPGDAVVVHGAPYAVAVSVLVRVGIVDHRLAQTRRLQDVSAARVQCGGVLPDRREPGSCCWRPFCRVSRSLAGRLRCGLGHWCRPERAGLVAITPDTCLGQAGSGCGWTGRCSACPVASGWTWAPRPRAWARTGPSGPPCPPAGDTAASWSAWAAISPWPGRRRGTAGRSPWPRSPIRTVRPAGSSSGWPRARSRPHR
jgi:hypothetical protein